MEAVGSLNVFAKVIARLQLGAGDDLEGLEEAVLAGGLEAQGLVALFDQVRSSGEALGAVAAALHRGSGQRFNVG